MGRINKYINKYIILQLITHRFLMGMKDSSEVAARLTIGSRNYKQIS
jgi:hypothetical protein